MERLTPSEEQFDAIFKIVTEPTRAALLACEIGTGKTLVAVEAVRELRAKTVLIVAPLNVRLGWKVTFGRQGIELPFHWINSTQGGKNAAAAYQANTPGVYFVGIEYFRQIGWVKKEVGVNRDGKPRYSKTRSKIWNNTHPDVFIFDESHKAANHKTATFKTLEQIKAGFRMCLSATWFGNTFEGAFSTTSWLWPNHVLNNRFAWIEEWCKTEYDPFSFSHKKVIGEKNPGAYVAQLPCVIQMKSTLEIDVTEEVRYVDLTMRQRKIYNSLSEEYIAWLVEESERTNKSPLVVEVPIALRARLRQTCLAEPEITPESEITFSEHGKSSKYDAMLDVLSDDFEGEATLILCDSAKFVRVVTQKLKNAGYAAEEWSGATPDAEREAVKQRFISGETKYVVAVYAALGEGVDMMQHATRNILRLNHTMVNGVLEEQTIGRIIRRGQERDVRIVTILAVDTVDTDDFEGLHRQAEARMKSLGK